MSAGTVVTFYSYKGGVGRSFALANVATLLGRWGFRVLCIDWDLEAPGLEDFFRPYVDPTAECRDGGMVELFTDFAASKTVPLEWRRLVQPLRDSIVPGVEFIKAGHFDATYMRRTRKLNWLKLYKLGLGDALETMFDELRLEYDFVLIDARTGVTEFSGIVTAQLPDILAFLFTANEQSLSGATMVAKRASEVRNDLAIDRSRLLLLPIPARFESQVEYNLSSKWRDRFVDTLQGFYEGWANRESPVEKLIQASTIPYVPFWSFGERISAVEDRNFEASSINYSMETLAALLAHRLGQTRLLVESRDEYVQAAQRLVRPQKNSVFLSYSRENQQAAFEIGELLRQRGVAVYPQDSRPFNGPWAEPTRREMEAATHFVLLFGKHDRLIRSFANDARNFMRQAASDEFERQMMIFIQPDADPTDLPTFLRQYRFDTLEAPKAASEKILERIQPSTASALDSSTLSIRVSSDGDVPVKDVQVCALADNGTVIECATDLSGFAALELVPGKSYQILTAHPDFPSRIVSDFKTGVLSDVRLKRERGVGSLVIQSTGNIPGLKGRLNPIRDTSDRTYIYADNIAIDDGKPQPAQFALNKPFLLEDASGTAVSTVVRLIQGRTTLLDYNFLRRDG